MTQQFALDAATRQVVLDTLVDLLAQSVRRENEKTMMDRMFAHLESLDKPTMMKKLLGSFAKLDAAKRDQALDEMVQESGRRGSKKVQGVLCNVGFRYLFGCTDANGNLIVSERIRWSTDEYIKQQEARIRRK